MANFGEKWNDFLEDVSENHQAGAIAVKIIALLIIIAVVVYSEYMFLGIISVILPDGINRVGAIIGAVATGASVVILVAAKLLWVRPGGQFLWAWIFTGYEVVILMLNDMLAYSMHQGPVTGILASWQSITPASPVFALIGWLFMLFLDKSQQERHKDMELQAKKAKLERKYKEVTHRSEMQLKFNHLNQVTARLQDAINSEEMQARIADHARKMVDQVLTDVSGFSGFNTPQLPTAEPRPQIAPPSQQPVVMSSEAIIDETPDKNIVSRLFDAFRGKDEDGDEGQATGVPAKK